MSFLAAVPAAIGTLLSASTASAASVAAASVTLAEASAVVGAAGAGVSAYSSYKQSQFQGAIARQNAEIARTNADAALTTGAVAEEASRTATGRKVGAALAAQGANGVDVNFGSPLAHRGALQDEGDLDALTIRHNAASSALAYMQQSAGFTSESSLDKAAGKNALAGGALNIGASYIGGASSVAHKYATYKQFGVKGF